MHRMKTKYEMTINGKSTSKPHNPSKPKHTPKRNPERLTDNGTLDTFLHRIRLEILDETK